MRMIILKANIFFILIYIFFFSCQNEKSITQISEEFVFPEINWLDSEVYNQIKKTCRTYWDLNSMIDDTFEIKIKEGIGYVIDCDGYFEGELYHFGILVDENGRWINGGCTLKTP